MASGTFEGTVWEDVGEGPPVVLVHGLGLRRQMWSAFVTRLKQHHRVVTYDLLGHGESIKPPGPYEMVDFTDQLEALAAHLELDRFVIAGFSLGGIINRAFAVAHPARSSAIVVINSYHDRTPEQREAVLKRVEQARQSGPSATVEAALERWFTPEFGVRNPQDLDQVRQWVMANDPQVYPHLYRFMATCDADLVETIEAISCPALIIASADDPGNTPQMARAMGARIPGARVEVVPGLRHMGLWERPAAYLDLIEAFLRDHCPG